MSADPATTPASEAERPAREETLRKLRERILAFAASRLQRDAAEDIAQEVLILLHQKYEHVIRLEELVPLALRIMRFKMMAVRRKLARHGEYTRVPVDEVPLADPDSNPLEDAVRRQMRERLIEAIAGLGERCREMFRLKLAGKSFPEIQAILGAASINTVYAWDFRCRKQLLDRLGGSWEGSQ